MATDSVTVDIGDVHPVWYQFRHRFTDEPMEPDDPALHLEDPDGEVSDVAIHLVTDEDELAAAVVAFAAKGVTLEDGTGLYGASLEPDKEGRWYYRWKGDGAAKAADQVGFNVRRRRVGEPA